MNKLIVLLVLLTSSAANATLYEFSQNGFDDGASINGSFTAVDLNNSGIIIGSIFSNFSEITDFTLSFSGNSIVPAFTWGLSDLSYLGYNTSQSVLGVANPEGIATDWFANSGYTYVSGVYTNGQQGGDIIDWATGGDTSTGNAIIVSAAAPAPGTIWLIPLVLVGMIGAKHRQDRSIFQENS